jgi:dCTP deaminase
MNFIPPGVLNSCQLRELRTVDVIRSAEELVAEGSALDLHLASRGWHLDGSIKQIADVDRSVEEVCQRHGRPFNIGDAGIAVEKGHVAVIELMEQLDFSQHPWLVGEATGKSSIGRLDILTRLLVNQCPQYERVPTTYKGPLYIEVAPISFNIRLYKGTSLNQLRIHCGPQTAMESLIGRRLLFDSADGRMFSSRAQENSTLSVDMSPTQDKQLVAFVLKQGPLAELDFARKGKVDPADYFEPVRASSGSLTIEVDRFYILRSIERLALPRDIAVTGMAYSETLGELRIHYAGFAHPWFGMQRLDEQTGAPLIFEVRAHNFPIVVRHQEVFATIRFYRMSQEIPKEELKEAAYSGQELALSGFFSKRDDWP